jgi:GTP-binding protein EngB required for normal cell division
MSLKSIDGFRLEAVKRLATEAGAAHLANEARALSDRVRDGLFYVACVGQFKRGKSTLLNALVGHPVLPVGVVPVTAVVTVVRYGERLSARVRIAEGGWQEIAPNELARYVTEDQNPENRAGVVAVEVFVPSELLASGMCLVDTPGIGSVFAGNTEATRSFVPHVDAALVVLGADPPISADELELVQEIAKQCGEVLFVFNKADKLTQREINDADKFTRRVIKERANIDDLRLFCVSATERLAGQGPSRGWPELTGALDTLARRSGSDLVRAAEQRGLARLADRLSRHLDEQRGALLRPVEESEQRVQALRACVAEAERALSDLGHLFTAEQERLARIWSDRQEAFLKRAKPAARAELAKAIRAVEERRGPSLREKAIHLADEISRKWLDAWCAEAQPAAEALYVEAMRRFADLANGFLARLASAGATMAGLARTVEPETGFTFRSRLYYTSLMTLTTQTPAKWFLDLIRTREQQLRTLDRQVGEYLETLIYANSNRIVSDFDDRVLESRRRFQAQIRSALEEVATSAESALARAKECRAQGSQAVEHEVHRINMLRDRLEALGLSGKEVSP